MIGNVHFFVDCSFSFCYFSYITLNKEVAFMSEILFELNTQADVSDQMAGFLNYFVHCNTNLFLLLM